MDRPVFLHFPSRQGGSVPKGCFLAQWSVLASVSNTAFVCDRRTQLSVRPLSMLDNAHPAVTPPRENVTLWRYMDLTKLLSLLETRALHFSRIDQFEDPYEGVWSLAGVREARREFERQGHPPEALEQLINQTDSFRQVMYLNCWCATEHESAAMWKLYLQSPEGVAIKTDHDSLARSLERSPLRIRTTMVQYVDYDVVPIGFGNIFYPLSYKRESFSHEHELRALIWRLEDVNAPLIPAEKKNVQVEIDVENLIHAVHVSPTAPEWFGDLVERLLARYELKIPIERSGLYDRPSY